jgi:putative ABC transport system permease protein
MFPLNTQTNIAIRSAIRNFQKNKFYGSLNLLGLSLAFAVLTLIIAYYDQETNYESFHENADRIYRPTYKYTPNSDFEAHFARIPANYINELPKDIPEIEKLIRFQNKEQKYVLFEAQRFKPKHAYITDADVFSVFSLPLLKGNPTTALSQPYSVVITASIAQKYFSDTDVLGKELIITGNYSPEKKPYKITGVLKDLPANTHLPIDLLFSFNKPSERSGWAYVYTLLKEGTSIEQVKEKMPTFLKKHTKVAENNPISYEFQALKDIHLTSHLAREIKANGQAIYIKIFAGVALFVWLIALINFTNLSTVLTFNRGKEMGLRKILGATKKQLAFFLFIETIFYSLLSLFLGSIIAYFLFPYFAALTGISHFPDLTKFIPLIIGLALLTGLIAGLFPASIIASLEVLKSLQQGRSWSLKGQANSLNVKRLIISFQFTLTILLTASAFIAYQQFRFINTKNLGLQSEQVLTISNIPSTVKNEYQVFKNKLNNLAGVKGVSACMQLPSSEIRDVGPVQIKGQSFEEGKAPIMDIQVVDPDFINLMNLNLLAGKDYTSEMKMGAIPTFNKELTLSKYISSSPRKYLINDTARKQLGWKSPEEAIGKEIAWSNSGFNLAYGQIAGVLEDYHQESLKNKVDPIIMTIEPIWLSNILVKLETKNIGATVAEIDRLWNAQFPFTFEYAFLDELYNRLYSQDQIQLKLLSIFTLIALLLSCTGLISLVAYALKTRSKELAIRRVIGANMKNLTLLIGKEYFNILLIAALIGMPLSYWLVSIWLQNFAYRIIISPAIYVFLLLFAFVLLGTAIYLQVLKSNVNNPVEDLRDV